MLVYLQKNVSKMPEELVMLLKALAKASDVAGMPNVQSQIFFLRYICPALVQPQRLGGLDVVPEEMARTLMALAKVLQLVANKSDPKESDFAAPITV
jgi:hypothetical protein